MDTIVAPITPVIRSAVTVLRISGADSLRALAFLKKQGGGTFSSLEPRMVYHALYDDGSVRDDVVFWYFKSPNSYTGEDVLEISFHGNPLIVRSAVSSFMSLGIRFAEPGEFTRRAFINGKMDLSQAEAVEEMISAKSEAGLFYSYNQLKGGLKTQIQNLKTLYVDVLTVVEAYIDFPEEDLSDRELHYITTKYERIEADLKELVKSYSTLKAVNDAVYVSIAGRPNVGKSSILNCLLKENRAIVSDIPGTTRDFIDADMTLAGHPVKIVDTAGIRHTDDYVEKAGIERSLERVENSHIVIVVLDLSAPMTEEDKLVLRKTADSKRIVIGNKADIKRYSHMTDIDISVKTGMNVHEFMSILENLISQEDSQIHEHAVAVNERQKNGFQRMLASLEEIRIMGCDDLDALSFELRDSLNILSEITGETYTEEILSNIFNSFCIGK
ncbi:MAG: tRNA uridine-5-carboxymethylaminomethyl(34) synthesis GTPase MnmE [Geovibrio sp.]|nr:tRNA uridine-5-carboxymethylaminomethyl(34) synthesis GTPase MnmE [Geovibrio sp.]